jgi:hypothetical protein
MNGSNGGQTYYYSYKQFMCNANIIFQPSYENAINTYTIYLDISGTGNFSYNTTVSTTWHG